MGKQQYLLLITSFVLIKTMFVQKLCCEYVYKIFVKSHKSFILGRKWKGRWHSPIGLNNAITWYFSVWQNLTIDKKIFMDLSKAFDCNSCDLIIARLHTHIFDENALVPI